MIRIATTEDIPMIREMAQKAFPETYKEILSKEQIEYMMNMMYSEQSLRQQMTAENNVFYIWEGRGYVSFRYVGQMEDNTDLFHLEKIYVMPEAHGQGIGKLLFDTVVQAVKHSSAGHARIELNVNRYNKAISFYEHIGMHRDREGDFPIGNGFFMNDYIMVMDC